MPGMVRLAYIVTGDASVAEDLAQDAFVRVAGSFARLRDPESFGLYLRRTLLNLCKNHFRHRDIERGFLRSQPPSAPADQSSDVVSHDMLRVALMRLPERQRAAIALRYFEDLSVEDTARAMRCPPGTVKSLTARGLEGLSAALQPEVERP
jgi:RNA polymerase sigma-70 factor (sigma-E family)